MPLYGNLDGPTGNNKPVYANNANVFGVTAAEAANTLGHGPRVAHAGWVQQTVGKGYVASITITNAGQGVNANGFAVVTGGSPTTNANVYFTVTTPGSNAWQNTITAVYIMNPGVEYTTTPNVTLNVALTGYITAPSFSVTMGGKANRVSYETLVAMGSMTGDDPSSANTFPG